MPGEFKGFWVSVLLFDDKMVRGDVRDESLTSAILLEPRGLELVDFKWV